MPISARFLRTSAEKKKRGADVGREKGANGLATRHRRRLLLNQEEEKELAMRPALPWHIPLHGRYAQTHTIPSKAKRLPRSASPTLKLDEACARHLRPLPQQVSGPKSSSAQILHALQSIVKCHNRVFEVLFPQFQSRSMSSQNVVFALWVVIPCSTKSLQF